MHGMTISRVGSREPSTFCLSLAWNSTWIRLTGSQALRIPLPLLPMSQQGATGMHCTWILEMAKALPTKPSPQPSAYEF